MDLTFYNVDQLCSRVNLTHDRPLIDLSDVTFFRPFALVYLGMFLRYHGYHAGRGIGFTVQPPVNDQARAYLAQQNFWERFNFDPASIQGEKLNRFVTSTSLNDIVDIERRPNIAEEIGNEVTAVLRNSAVSVKVSTVAEVMIELVDNFAGHSNRSLAAVAMQYYPKPRQVVIAIGDCGIGIRASLASNPRHGYLAQAPHYKAALDAFEPLVSCKSEGGTGLTIVRDEVANVNGSFVLATGDGYVKMNNRGMIEAGPMAYDLPGVQMEIVFPEEP